MKNTLQKLTIIFITLLLLTSCNQQKNENLDPNSIFNLSSKWEQQDGKKIQLEDLRGKVLTMVMIYTSCKTACPRLTLDMKNIAENVGHKNSDDLRYVLVSIDPKKDTPETMRAFLANNGLDNQQWIFLRSSEDNTRELANVLAMKYKKISPMDFSHSNIISVFSKEGLLVNQKEGLSIDIDNTVKAIKKELNK